MAKASLDSSLLQLISQAFDNLIRPLQEVSPNDTDELQIANSCTDLTVVYPAGGLQSATRPCSHSLAADLGRPGQIPIQR